MNIATKLMRVPFVNFGSFNRLSLIKGDPRHVCVPGGLLKFSDRLLLRISSDGWFREWEGTIWTDENKSWIKIKLFEGSINSE